MQKTVPPFTISENLISVQEVPRYIEDWLINSSISQHSPRAINERKDALNKFVWFLNENEYSASTRFVASPNFAVSSPTSMPGTQTRKGVESTLAKPNRVIPTEKTLEAPERLGIKKPERVPTLSLWRMM